MEVKDIISIYSAILSSLLALIQIKNHRISNKLLHIRQSDEFRLFDGFVNITITNLSGKEIDLDFVGVGIGFRPWLSPWIYRVDEAWGLRVFSFQGMKDITYLDPLKAGQMVYAELIDRSQNFLNIRKFSKRGFAHKVCVTITHSMCERDLIHTLKLT